VPAPIACVHCLRLWSLSPQTAAAPWPERQHLAVPVPILSQGFVAALSHARRPAGTRWAAEIFASTLPHLRRSSYLHLLSAAAQHAEHAPSCARRPPARKRTVRGAIDTFDISPKIAAAPTTPGDGPFQPRQPAPIASLSLRNKPSSAGQRLFTCLRIQRTLSCSGTGE